MSPEELAELIRSRRTDMVVDHERPVPRDLVEQLCDLAMWAPNHKRTWPWQFALAEGDGRAKLGNVIADAMEVYGDPPERVLKGAGTSSARLLAARLTQPALQKRPRQYGSRAAAP